MLKSKMKGKLNLSLLKVIALITELCIRVLRIHVIVVTWAQGICLRCMPKALGLQARGLRAYISGESRTPMLQVPCVTSGTLKICLNLQVFALPIYITMSIHFDYGIFT